MLHKRYEDPSQVNWSQSLAKWRGRFYYSRMLRKAGVPEDARILDVGTASGAIFRARFPDKPYQVVGVDFLEEMVKEAKEISRSDQKSLKGVNAQVVRASGHQLPFQDGSFDIVIDSFLLPYLAQMYVRGDTEIPLHEEALREYRRVLDNDGKLLLYPSLPASQSWGLDTLLSIDSSIDQIFPHYDLIRASARYFARVIPRYYSDPDAVSAQAWFNGAPF